MTLLAFRTSPVGGAHQGWDNAGAVIAAAKTEKVVSGALKVVATTKKVDPASLLRDALLLHSRLTLRMETTDAWTCSRAELLELLDSAPAGFLQAYFYAVHFCRAQWAAGKQVKGWSPLTKQQRLLLSEVNESLQDEMDLKTMWSFRMESTDLMTCPRPELARLLASAPAAWRGYLVGVTEWRATTGAFL